MAASNGGSEAQPSSHVAGENPIYQSKREALPKTGTGHTKYYGTGEELNQRECVSDEKATGQNKKMSDSGASKMEIQEVCRKEQQQPGGFARRNSKKIQPNKVRNQIVSQVRLLLQSCLLFHDNTDLAFSDLVDCQDEATFFSR